MRFLDFFNGVVTGLAVGVIVLYLLLPTPTQYSKDLRTCSFAQGYKAATDFIVNEKGEPLLGYTPLSGDIQACEKISEQL